MDETDLILLDPANTNVGGISFFNGGAVPDLKRYSASLFSLLGTGGFVPLDKQKSQSDREEINLLDDVVEDLPDWQMRDQRRRGTCTAFAVATCLELQLRMREVRHRLSPEFLYWFMTNDDLDVEVPDSKRGATKILQARKVLEARGICGEDSAPYQHKTLFSSKEPSQEAIEEGITLRAKAETYFDLHTEESFPKPFGEVVVDRAATIYECLNRGLPVAAGVPMFRIDGVSVPTDWTNPKTLLSGVVKSPLIAAYQASGFERLRVSAHVVAIIGYQNDKDAPGGGWFIFKNSWGQSYGTRPSKSDPELPGTGYGAIAWADIKELCWEFASFELIGKFKN